MADVKWIKITTNMFEDEKIDFIESLPEADAILVVWIKLLTMAGKCNAGGYLLLTENIPYTTEMLSHKFRKPLNTVKLALETLQRLEMITLEDLALKIVNWEKHQNVEGLEKIREQDRLRKQRQRERERQQLLGKGKEGVTGQSRDGHATDTEEDRDKDIKSKKKQPISHKYGEYTHVLLTDDQLAKLKDKFPADYESRIRNLDEYIEMTDKKYKNHYLTLIKWAERDKKKIENTKESNDNPYAHLPHYGG